MSPVLRVKFWGIWQWYQPSLTNKDSLRMRMTAKSPKGSFPPQAGTNAQGVENPSPNGEPESFSGGWNALRLKSSPENSDPGRAGHKPPPYGHSWATKATLLFWAARFHQSPKSHSTARLLPTFPTDTNKRRGVKVHAVLRGQRAVSCGHGTEAAQERGPATTS